MAVEYPCCDGDFVVRILIVIGLVLFAGLMSGLTLGLMSLSLVDLEVLVKSGKPAHRSYAEKILPVVRKQHLLLCTLLICNAAAMEALPIFLDGLMSAWGAIFISVTLILLFGEIIPQSFCSRYGLAVGATIAPFVRVLVWLCFPVAYPISKLLDILLGEEHDPLFRRAELKTLLDFHGNEAGRGGELTRDETTIIAGALELGEKTASDAMTPIDETFTVDVNAKLDKNLMKVISQKGHSRIPIYHDQPKNIIGLVLVKNLLRIKPDAEVSVKRVAIRKIPRVPETMPLYDILNEFQKGHSHMAVVVRRKVSTEKSTARTRDEKNDIRLDIPGEDNNLHERAPRTDRTDRTLKKLTKDAKLRRGAKSKTWSKDFDSDFLRMDNDSLPELGEEGEAVGIITLEDVIEELLQEEIYDETDHRNDTHHL